MKLFALELGNRQVKMLSEKGIKVYPSYFIDSNEYGNRSILNFAKNEENTSDYVSSLDMDFTYVWGKKLDISNRHITDTIAFTDRYDSLEFLLLTDFALAEMARDFKQATNGELEVVVITGIPSIEYEQNEIVAKVQTSLKGKHTVFIDDTEYNILVKHVYVLTQTTGTAIDAMVNEFGNIIDDNDIEDNYIGIVDAGGGTVIVDAFNNMNLDTNNRLQLEEGAHALYSAIRNAVTLLGHKITDYEVERLLRQNSVSEQYQWSPNKRDFLDLTEIVMRERKRYTRKIATAVKTTLKSIAKMKVVYVTGGTANLLIKEEFKRVIPIAWFVIGSETANVRGFYKYGLANGVTGIEEESTH
ncbi:hypothetical protein NSQ62_08180 [Solibacillus sp. FSL H8-0523]|uniref:ParM/StbA family protein n=1 Tax=Solibacillus sp. FSL H8-0523 TaxID=2954511 RepID=UPI0031014A63